MQVDLFTNVHKGIRRALFETVLALGRDEAAARDQLRGTLHFVAHHGANEDDLLVPLLPPELGARMIAAHGALEAELSALCAAVETAPLAALHAQTAAFTARYLAHMDDEERVLEPMIRAAVPGDRLAAFARESVKRTAPDDARMMLTWMIPAMPHAEAEAFLARMPAAVADALRPLVA